MPAEVSRQYTAVLHEKKDRVSPLSKKKNCTLSRSRTYRKRGGVFTFLVTKGGGANADTREKDAEGHKHANVSNVVQGSGT